MTQQKSFDSNTALWCKRVQTFDSKQKDISQALYPHGLMLNEMKWSESADAVPEVKLSCYYDAEKDKSSELFPISENWPSDLFRMMNAFGDINGQKKPDRKAYDNDLVPIRIQKNGPAMIVFWRDGTKTIVRRGEDEPDSDYAAFTAALGIKAFGSNSQLKKIVSMTETQKPKKPKEQKEQKVPECSDDDGVRPFDVDETTEDAEQTETVIDQHDEPVTTEQAEQKSDALDALQRVAEKFGMTVEEAFQKIKEAQKD